MDNNDFGPIPGSAILNGIAGRKMIVMAANLRITSVATGIFRAAKDTDSALIVELAKSECDLKGGYSGLTPKMFSERANAAARDAGFDIWALHADHITVKKGDSAEIEDTKKLIDAQIDAGYTSFAIDASHLFNFQGKNLREELDKNIVVTTELAKHIEKRMNGKDYGLEVEVGEIGRKDGDGMVLTRPEEAVTFIRALNENDVYPQVIAIANGSSHGNVYDEHGNPVEQVSIDIPLTKAVARALRENNLNVGIAQHGITGTPRELINTQFPKGDIIKGNVATFWQNLVFDIFKVYEPELYMDIRNWTLETYREKNPGKKDIEIFGKNAKFAIKEFFDRIYGVEEDTTNAIEAMAYAESLTFFRAFGSKGSASIVRESMKI
ncbi:MAG: class II fructose-bisphosphate aldolase [Candidatus Methanoperedens sp.]